MKEISLKCSAHIGDCLLQLQWCIKVCKSDPDIIIHYWVSDSYHKQLQDFIEDSISDRLIIENLHKLTVSLKETWINSNGELNYWLLNVNKYSYYMIDVFYIYYFDMLSEYFNIDNPIKTSYDFLFDTSNLLKDNILSNEYDFFILNSVPKSGQCNIYDKNAFIDVTKQLVKKGYKVITTEPTGLSDVPSTIEHDLSLLDIGNISIKSKNIISVHTGTIHGTFNIYNIDSVINRFIVNTASINYTFKNCHYVDYYKKIMDIIDA